MKTKKGFTLVELLVVIAIIGLLSTIAFVSLNRARAKARDAKRLSDVRGLQSALELYYNDQATPQYPASAATLGPLTSGTGAGQLASTYLTTIPTAPTPVDGPDCEVDADNQYTYMAQTSQTTSTNCTTGACGWYNIGFCLGGATGGLTQGCVIASPSGISDVGAENDSVADIAGTCLLGSD